MGSLDSQGAKAGAIMKYRSTFFDYPWVANTGTARVFTTAAAIGVLWLTGGGMSIAAANLCVNPHGRPRCSASIQAAVNAASPGDTIHVAHGTYKEQVTITKSLSLVGA